MESERHRKAMGRKGARGVVALSAAGVLVAAVLTTAAPASAASTAYYVDGAASCVGATGSISNPHCSFAALASVDFEPGDTINIARGSTIDVSVGGSLTLTNEDDGSSAGWLKVQPYGSGARPKIVGSGSDKQQVGIRGTDLDYLHVTGIEFEDVGKAIWINYRTSGHTGIQLDNLYIHDLVDADPYSGSGIAIDTGQDVLTGGRTATASSTESGYSASRVTDGDTGDWTGWSSASGQAMPQWVEVDLGGTKTVGRIDVFTNSGYPLDDFTFQYWNGSSWITPAGGTIVNNTAKWRFVEFTPASASKVRIHATSGDGYGIARVEELMAFPGSFPSVSPSTPVLSSITIVDSVFEDLGMPIVIDGIYTVTPGAFKDILVLRNYLHNVRWVNALRYVESVHWLNNRHVNVAQGYLGGTTDMHLWAVDYAKFDNNIFDTIPDNDTHDQVFGDLAYRLDELFIRGNVFTAAAGPALEWHGWRQVDENGRDTTHNYYSDQVVESNLFLNNATSTTPYDPQYVSALLVNDVGGGCATRPAGGVGDNIYYEPTGFLNDAPCDHDLVLANNRPIQQLADAYSAAYAFSDSSCAATPWSWQSSTNGTSWTTMSTVDTVASSTDVRCRGGSAQPWVSRFEMMPNSGSTSSVARSWTAPSSGAVSIRGLVLKVAVGTDGVTVKVTKNGATVIGPTAVGSFDRNGVAMNADEVPVTAGDVIRFEVAGGSTNTGDLLSWAPTVSYASTNLAASATITASSTNPSYCTCRVADGDASDWQGWSAAGAVTTPEWVELAWGSAKTIGRVDVTTTGSGVADGYETRDFAIQYWNGSTWVSVAGASVDDNDRKHVSFEFTPISASKLRVYITQGDVPSGGARIDELEVYSF